MCPFARVFPPPWLQTIAKDRMSKVTAFPSGTTPEQRGLSYWMDRVLKELGQVRTASDADSVHDLRVAIRRCRSLAAVMMEVDADPAWAEMRKLPRKLFRGLGPLRDAQVMEQWVHELGQPSDPIRNLLHAAFEKRMIEMHDATPRLLDKFDDKSWRRLARTLRKRVRLVPAGSLAAECLALERLEEAKERHSRALRTEKPEPWHELRIALKKFRYTVENLLPAHYAACGENLKRVQDLLGDLHDLVVLAKVVKEVTTPALQETGNAWLATIEQERQDRIKTYRRLMLGKTSLWNEWRHALPRGERLETAALARLSATARAADLKPRRTAQVRRLARRLFELLARTHAAPVFVEARSRRLMKAATLLHGIGAVDGDKSPSKTAKKFVLALPLPPGWTFAEWEVLAATVRYHRGAEPRAKHTSFAAFSEEQQKTVRALAGVLRLTRALRQSGVKTPVGFRMEKLKNAVILRVPELDDSPETAALMASAKHLLETALDLPMIVRSLPKPEPAVQPQIELVPLLVRAAAASD
jgi:CHAD domain-containing protein